MNIDLRGKNAFVSGSSKGIGRAVAITLAELGAEVTVVARTEAKLQQLVIDLPNAYGQNHDFLVADFGNPDTLSATLTSGLHNKNYHILINNAGGPPAGPIVTARPEEFIKAMNMHVVSYHIVTQHLLPGMKSAGYGRIINVISTSVKTPLDNLGVSNTIRGAVASWGKTMANELGQYGITVNNVLPGFIDTERLSEVFQFMAKSSGVGKEEYRNSASQGIPLGRIGTPREIADVIAFLASPAGGYVSGVNLPVDGGRTKAM